MVCSLELPQEYFAFKYTKINLSAECKIKITKSEVHFVSSRTEPEYTCLNLVCGSLWSVICRVERRNFEKSSISEIRELKLFITLVLFASYAKNNSR